MIVLSEHLPAAAPAAGTTSEIAAEAATATRSAAIGTAESATAIAAAGTTAADGHLGARLVLPFAQRQKGRQRAELEDGTPVAIVLRRGIVLRGGDRLRTLTGELVEVVAAPENVSTAAAEDPWLLARAAYHLGNRHVPLEIGRGYVRYLRDHVLDAMLARLSLTVSHERTPFEPEAGAYAEAHRHAGGHPHAH